MNKRSWTIWGCPDCGHTNMHADTCHALPGEPVEHGNGVVVVPASEAERLRETLERITTASPSHDVRGIALKPASDEVECRCPPLSGAMILDSGQCSRCGQYVVGRAPLEEASDEGKRNPRQP